MNYIRPMPLPSIRLTKIQAETPLALQLANKSDGCINSKSRLEKPALVIETLGAIPQKIVVYREDLKDFLASEEPTVELNL